MERSMLQSQCQLRARRNRSRRLRAALERPEEVRKGVLRQARRRGLAPEVLELDSAAFAARVGANAA